MDDSHKQPRGRDHHKKKRRKALRARFDRRKNDERRRWQQASKESVDEQPVNTNSAVSLPECISSCATVVLMEDSRKQPRGRDHHKKKKRKGLRARFDRRKNDERRRQQASKENIRSVDEQPVNTNSAVSLPEHWRKISSSTSTQYCKLENTLDGVCQVTASVVFSSEGAWNVYACGKKVPESCYLLKEFPSCISTINALLDLISAIDTAVYCPGNPDDDFVKLCQTRGGEMKGSRGSTDVVAYIDSSCAVMDPNVVETPSINGFRPNFAVVQDRLRFSWLICSTHAFQYLHK